MSDEDPKPPERKSDKPGKDTLLRERAKDAEADADKAEAKADDAIGELIATLRDQVKTVQADADKRVASAEGTAKMWAKFAAVEFAAHVLIVAFVFGATAVGLEIPGVAKFGAGKGETPPPPASWPAENAAEEE